MEGTEIPAFGEVLATFRNRAELSQRRLADQLGKNRRTIAAWEAGDYLPKTKGDLLSLARILALDDEEATTLLKAAGINPHFTIWNVPYSRNPFFIGRKQELERLHEQLQQATTAAIGQAQSVSGLGGIGKTQLTVEYAYRHREEYQYVLWARAESIDALNTSYSELARLLSLPEKDAKEQEKITQAVKHWLQHQYGWLLILDNADNPTLLPDFLPSTVGGHVLITTRAADMSSHLAGLAHPVVLDIFPDEQGALFLFHRANLLPVDAALEQAEEKTRHLAMDISYEMGGLPLALDQAGAYIYTTQCGLDVYQQIYQRRRAQLLARPGGAYHPESVATTWDISFHAVEQRNPAAADLLRLCAYLSPDAIPEEIITKGQDALGSVLASLSTDPFLLSNAIEDLRAYSLLTRDPGTRTLTIHRLVQAVLRNSMAPENQQQWMQRAIEAVEVACDFFFFGDEDVILRLIPHLLHCVTWIKQWPSHSYSLALSLCNMGLHFQNHPESKYFLYWELMYEEALAVFEVQKPFTDSDILFIGGHLTDLYGQLRRYREAEQVILREVELFGEEHPDSEGKLVYLADLLNEQMEFYCENGMLEEAERVGRHVLKLCEDRLGENHPATRERLLDYLEVLSETHTGGDLAALLEVLKQGKLDNNEDEGVVERESS